MNPPQQRPTVLIVDDDPGIRKMLVEVLALEGYPTETANDGKEALDLLPRSGPRVVLLDLLMPNVDGAGVVAALEQQPSERNRHHIILVSAFTNLELERYRNLRVDGKLHKPFTVDQLLNVIDSVEVH
jgi:CheY-like chemotaxis protein